MDFAINIVLNKFNNFSGIDGESIEELIKRYIELYWEMVRLKITKTNEEWVNKLENALPGDEWRTYLSDWKKRYLEVTLSMFIEKIKERELELQKNSNVEIDEAKFKSEENVREEEEQVKEISAIKVEKKAESEKMTEKCLNCENLKSENAKLLRDLESLTLENKNFKNSENDLKIQIKNLGSINGCGVFVHKIDNSAIIILNMIWEDKEHEKKNLQCTVNVYITFCRLWQ